jgi:hypothetical protein
MLIGADDQTTTTTTDNDPELLIEEARQRQRRRQKRQTAALLALAGLVILGLGADRIARSGNAPPASKPRGTPIAAHQPGVIYEKVETVVSIPHRPTFRRTGEVWFSPTAPWTYRELVTIAGGPTLEVGAAPGHDPKPPHEILDYLYEAQANAVYETGASLEPSAAPPNARTDFRQFLALPGARLEGTRLFDGHKVYAAAVGSSTLYVDTATYRPLLFATSLGTSGRVTIRVLAYRTLPATPTNLALTSLARAHAGAARVERWPPPPRIHRLYDEANQIGSLVSLDLGPYIVNPMFLVRPPCGEGCP